jgi:hypothetical protein
LAAVAARYRNYVVHPSAHAACSRAIGKAHDCRRERLEMRNLGSAIGIAIIDTIVYSRSPEHARALVDRLAAGDSDVARTLGIPPDALVPALLDSEKQSTLAPLVDKVAFTQAINDAWAFIALPTLAALVVVPLARRAPRCKQAVLH